MIVFQSTVIKVKKKNIYKVHRRSQDFWLEGRGKPQITHNDVIKIFQKEGLFVGQRYHKMECDLIKDQMSGLGWHVNRILPREGLEQKVEKVFKIVKVERRGEQTCLTQTYHRLGYGGRTLGDFFKFFLEKKAILIYFGSYFARF